MKSSGPIQTFFIVILLGVVLTSALMRLQLYESAFGFTRLRTYTHIFIFWLAILLAGFLVLLYLQRLRTFAVIALVAGRGFASMGISGKGDGFVALRNLERFEKTDDLDVAYLTVLTQDAYPAIAKWDADTELEMPLDLSAHLACQAGILSSEQGNRSWQSFHIGRQRASNALNSLEDALRGHGGPSESDIFYLIDTNGEVVPCFVESSD